MVDGKGYSRTWVCMTRRTVLWTGITAATVVAVVVAVVSFSSWGGHSLPQPVAVAGADLSGSGPGSLVSATTMPRFSQDVGAYGIRAARVVYRSTSGAAQPTVVSGSVYIPEGVDPPDGGWPVVSYGHGTTGLDEPCAPSLSDSLLGYADEVYSFVRRGYAVAFTDYQGLGAPGVHPYTDARTAALNMIDAVRALRATFKNVSSRWAAYGGSQGGGAVWAADEQARSYAPELNFVGAVAISPAADLVGLVQEAQQGTVSKDHQLALIGVIESLARLHPDINRDDYRRGAVAQYWDILVSCSGPNMPYIANAQKRIGPHDVTVTSPEAADRLRHYLSQWALPQQRLSAPLLVWYGGADTIIDSRWTAGAIQRACALGGTVVVRFEIAKGHGESNEDELIQWLSDRFAGKAVTSDCT